MFASSTPWGVWTVIMERVHQLEPRLQAFWEGFPCPPPWKEELLFRLNWTGCIGAEVGERVKMFMADKCKIRHDGASPYPGNGDANGESDDDGVMVEEDCGLTCQVIVALVSVLFFVILFILVVYCIRRKRAKAASPSHQSSLTAHADGNAKYYTSCHYASTPVVARQLQTSVSANGTETRIVDSSDSNSLLYQPGCYPQHSCHSPLGYHHMHHHHHHHHPHAHHQHHLQQQQPRLINTPYGQVPAHTSSLIVPHTSRYNASLYRKFDPTYSSSSVSNSDRSPVYESIDDTDSIRQRTRGSTGARDASISECEFCECGVDHGSDQGIYSGYHDLEGPQPSDSDTYTDKLGTTGFPPDIEPPCPPLCPDGYYGDRCSQTLPLRPIRGHPPNKGNNQNNTAEFSALDFNELSPLNQQHDPHQNPQDSNTNPSNPSDNPNGNSKNDQGLGIRRRPSSGNYYNSNGAHHTDAHHNGGARRPIPALHPNYFVTNQEEIS